MVIAACAVTCVLAACTGGGTAELAASSAWGFGPSIDQAIQEATAAGASDEQIATLERWLEIQDTPYADLEQSMQRFFTCLDGAGIEHEYAGVAGGADYPEPQYRVMVNPDLSDGAMQNIMADCDAREFFYVNMIYQTGPGVAERRQREDAAFLPTAIACLEDHGIVLDEVATLDDLNLFLTEQGIEDSWGCTSPPYSNADF
jgi:hypothetical protein